MRHKSAVDVSTEVRRPKEPIRNAILEKRRRYNRLYMRSWRADPHNRSRDRDMRQHWDYRRKLREAQQHQLPFTNDCGDPVCGFCGKNPPVREVMRLRVCETARRGFVQVRIPYCGLC